MAFSTVEEISSLSPSNDINLDPLEPNDKYIWKLVNNINILREDMQFIDVILICTDGSELPCHRIILAASNCSFFHNILLHAPPITENCPARLLLPSNLRGYCVSNIISFMYTGSVEMPDDTNQVKELLATSRFLKLDDFNKQMAAVLVRSLTIDNYTFVWDLADEYDVQILRNEVVNFVSKDLPKFLVLPEFLFFDVNRVKLLLASPHINIQPHNKILLGVIAWLKKDFANREKEIGQLMRYIKFCMLSKPFLKSVINTEPLVQESHTLWCFIAATLYSRGVHLQNYDPERDNITNPPEKIVEDLTSGDGTPFVPPVMTEPLMCSLKEPKPRKIMPKEVPKLPPRKSPATNVYIKQNIQPTPSAPLKVSKSVPLPVQSLSNKPIKKIVVVKPHHSLNR